jgi:D-alanyl-D-alanine carboxypeptidase
VKHRLIALVLFSLLAPATVPAATQSAAPFADSPLGRRASELVAAINSGDRARQLAFLERSLSRAALEQTPLEKHAALLARVYEQSGGLDVMRVVHSDGPVVDFFVRSKRGDHWAFVYIFGDNLEPGRIAEFGIFGKPNPDAEKADEWPAARIAAAEVVPEIARHVERAAAEDRFSGVVLVAKGDEVLFHKAYGFADRAFGVPNRLDTKFHLGSMNKMFTAVAIAQLVEAGKLSFDDPLAKVLPEYPNREAAEKIRIHHLLTHTAGLGGLFERARWNRHAKYPSHMAIVEVFAGEPLHFEPGTKASYSNEGFVVLGAVVEKLTGRDYHDYVRERILAPAGMTDTGPFALDEATPNRAVGYGRFEDDPLGIEPRRPNWMFLGWRGNACGGGYSTAPDMLRFARAMHASRFVSPAMTAKLTTAGTVMRFYGYGFESREIEGRKVYGHGGGGPSSGVNSDMRTFADGSYTVVALGNYDAPAASDLLGGIVRFLALQHRER